MLSVYQSVAGLSDRHGDSEPFLGAGEAAQGPAAGALSNAVAKAIGTRIRDIPFTRARVKAAINSRQRDDTGVGDVVSGLLRRL
jgi:CO/xanthine dehydrogenase Mo-binding subunit